jgi:hypothetical protein
VVGGVPSGRHAHLPRQTSPDRKAKPIKNVTKDPISLLQLMNFGDFGAGFAQSGASRSGNLGGMGRVCGIRFISSRFT